MYTHTHTYTQYTQTQWNIIQYKKEWNSAMCSNMDGPKDYQTKWSRLERERQISYHLYAESKIWNKLTYLQNRNTHRHWKETCGCKGGGQWEFDINRCKLWYMEKINKIPSYQGHTKQDTTI